MRIYSFSDEEFTYLAFYLFAIDFDEPPQNWDYGIERGFSRIFQKLRDSYLGMELLLSLEGRNINGTLEKYFNILLSEEEIEMICDENEVALRYTIDDPNFEEYLERGNSLLKTFSKPPLSLVDLTDDPST